MDWRISLQLPCNQCKRRKIEIAAPCTDFAMRVFTLNVGRLELVRTADPTIFDSIHRMVHLPLGGLSIADARHELREE